MSVQQTRAPKRPVLRVRNRIDDTIASSISNVILHTSTDPETLVRIILKLTMVPNSNTAVDHEYHMLMEHQPQGQSITDPVISAVVDADAPITLLWEDSAVNTIESLIGFATILTVEVDLKSMRKLKPGSVIALRHIGNVASTFTMKGTITLFFKQ